MTEKHTCEKRLYSRYCFDTHGHLCGNAATLQDEGKWYCKTHHPPTRNSKWAAKWEAIRVAQESRDAAYLKRCEQRNRADADRARMEALQEAIVDTIYLDDGSIIDVKGDLREAIDQWIKGREVQP